MGTRGGTGGGANVARAGRTSGSATAAARRNSGSRLATRAPPKVLGRPRGSELTAQLRAIAEEAEHLLGGGGHRETVVLAVDAVEGPGEVQAQDVTAEQMARAEAQAEPHRADRVVHRE